MPESALNGAIGVRLILNGFPKSGLHLCNTMARCMLKPWFHENWIGSFGESAWGTEWSGVEKSIGLLSWMKFGSFVKGHIGHRQEFVDVMDENAIGMVFIFRDPRDVLCSIKRHLEQENGQQYIHPGRELFYKLEGDEKRLLALLDGFGPWAGLFERWEMYAPWLEQENVLPMPYEYMRLAPRQAALTFIRYILGRATMPNGLMLGLYDSDVNRHVDWTVEQMKKPQLSATFIKGQVGSWREEFTPKVAREFSRQAGDWLELLGYEKDKEWIQSC